MGKATAPQFASAKRAALRALGQQAQDEYVPDRVCFFNDELGFIFRFSDMASDKHVQRVVSWVHIDVATFDVIGREVDLAVQALASVQIEH